MTEQIRPLDNRSNDQLDELADKLGSYALARLRLGITDETVTSESSTLKAKSRIHSASRRGGRSYPESHGEDWDLTDGIERDAVSAQEQQEINRRGHELVKRVIAKAREAAEPMSEADRQVLSPTAEERQARVNASWGELESRRTDGHRIPYQPTLVE